MHALVEFLKFFLCIALAVAALVALGFVAEPIMQWYERSFSA